MSKQVERVARAMRAELGYIDISSESYYNQDWERVAEAALKALRPTERQETVMPPAVVMSMQSIIHHGLSSGDAEAALHVLNDMLEALPVAVAIGAVWEDGTSLTPNKHLLPPGERDPQWKTVYRLEER